MLWNECLLDYFSIMHNGVLCLCDIVHLISKTVLLFAGLMTDFQSGLRHCMFPYVILCNLTQLTDNMWTNNKQVLSREDSMNDICI